jgi:aminoglycoside phosphotransferase family enzyme/predicted kinase
VQRTTPSVMSISMNPILDQGIYDDRTQDAVFSLLSNPATYAGNVKVHRCETHAAVVFLAGNRALKVKKAVQFPFLDYSTLEKRKAACSAELEVNRRFAPQLYRRIVPITRESNGELALDGRGEAIEWAVEMTRFDENQTLDHIADRGEFDEKIASKLADAVLSMHDRAEPVEATSWLSAIEKIIDQNSEALRQYDSLFSMQSVIELDRKTHTAFNRLLPLLSRRGKQGLIRRGHGDLHLGNIAMLDGEPIAFDAIEFDPMIASGDVLYDLAFLLMDVIERSLYRPANVILNGYYAAAHMEDYDGLAALPLFMSLRAAIRAKVIAARLNQSVRNNCANIVRNAGRYFELALELMAKINPQLICIGGFSGTGKSVLARSLAPFVPPQPGALVLRSDVERKHLFGVHETDRLPPSAYCSDVSKRVYAILNEKANRIVRAGHSVIIDAVFAELSHRAAVENVARDASVRFRGLFLTADLGTRIKRISGRGPDASDADVELACRQENGVVGAVAWNTVDAGGSTEQTFANARANLT